MFSIVNHVTPKKRRRFLGGSVIFDQSAFAISIVDHLTPKKRRRFLGVNAIFNQSAVAVCDFVDRLTQLLNAFLSSKHPDTQKASTLFGWHRQCHP